MALEGRIEVSSKKMENLKRRMMKLAQAKVQSGHFTESGDHPEAAMPYSTLAFLLKDTYPYRDLRVGVSIWFRGNHFNNILTESTKDYLYKSKPLNKSLGRIGEVTVDYAKGLFGEPSAFNPSNVDWWADLKGGDTPLLFEGYLRDSWAYKTLPDGSIRYTR